MLVTARPRYFWRRASSSASSYAFMLQLICCFCCILLSALGHSAPSPLPASDPANHGHWIPFAPLTDEFDTNALDTTRWSTAPRDIGWAGRAPGLFDPTNTAVADGTLLLGARAARRNASWPAGFDNFTTSAVHSVNRTAHGYFEVRSRSGSSCISSSFWFHQNSGGSWTEIDVFESTGNSSTTTRGGETPRQICSHTHVFKLAGVATADLPGKCGCKLEGAACSVGACTPLPFAVDDAFHTYGLQWNATTWQVFVDGAAVGPAFDAACLQEPIGMDFDRETMPYMGVPDSPFVTDRPFAIDYVRAWKQGAGTE